MMRAVELVRSWTGPAAAGVLLVVLGLPAVAAAAPGPFDGLEGVWTGDGTLTYASGTQERLTCRVQYQQPTPTNLTQALRCTSDSYNFQINAAFSSTAGRLAGSWSEVVQNLSGSVSGTVANGRISGALKGPGFAAQLNVVTKGNTQTVDIEAPVQDIRGVSIQVRKSTQ
jgi:hypothetical protein